jgi:uncharacterized protein (TIGR03067 family)
MQRITMLLIWLAFSATPSVAAPALKSKKNDDATRILGTWKQDSVSVHGGQPAFSPDTTFRFSNDGTCGIANGSNENPAKYFLDTSKSPRRMKWLNGREMTEWLCLYELEGDTLKVVFVDPGTEAPQKFEPAKNLTIYFLKRVKE